MLASLFLFPLEHCAKPLLYMLALLIIILAVGYNIYLHQSSRYVLDISKKQIKILCLNLLSHSSTLQ